MYINVREDPFESVDPNIKITSYKLAENIR